MSDEDSITKTLPHAALSRLELPGLRICVRTPDGHNKELKLGLEPLTVGSSAECDLFVEDPGVSRTHCRLMRKDGLVDIRDLESKNGTFIGGVRIVEALLAPGDIAKMGNCRLSIVSDGSHAVVPLSLHGQFGAVLGTSVKMRALFAQLERISNTSEPILLLGESGTGKELIAQAIHAASTRAAGPLVVFDCGAVAPTLVEAELFGHAKGAFTGATTARVGLLHEADGGTLFIDEVGELPLELQTRLLRVLETKEARALGSTTYKKSDVRIVAATHRDLRARVAQGTFREDLYYRLAVVELRIPPLRERREDIALLVEHHLSSQTPPLTLADLPPQSLELLKSHDWPGNVRELRNTVTRLVLFPHLGADAINVVSRSQNGDLGALARLPLREARETLVAEFEQRYVTAKLAEHGGQVSLAARAMGVSRQFAHRLITRYGLGVGHDDD